MALKIPTRSETTAVAPDRAQEPAVRRVRSTPGNGAAAKSTFAKVTSGTVKRRMIVSLCGEEKTGKNHCAFTFPGPLYVHSFDIGIEGVVEKFVKDKDIYVADYELDIDIDDMSAQQVSDAADVVWKQFMTNYRDGLASCGNGTTVIDTDTEVWELLRLARFGKLSQVMPHMYGPVNAEFRDVVREAFNHNGSAVLLGKRVDEWENYTGSDGKEKGRKTGNKVRKGFTDLPFLVQINAQTQRTDMVGGGSEFKVLIEDCRFNPGANGLLVDNDYDLIAQLVFE